MSILVLNCGSSSVKFQVLHFEEKGEASKPTTLKAGVIEEVRDPVAAIAEVLARIAGLEIEAVGHRVVHGGPDFHSSQLIDADVLAKIEACVPLAPLHNPANLAGIRAAQAALPVGVPHVAVFDTAFHNRLPRRARTYALPQALNNRLQLRRYGFHGLSHAYVAGRAAEHLGRPLSELRVITLHLGNGASACAVEYGHSVETSMGLTPLEGLVMGTRVGDLDPGVVIALMRDGMDADTIDQLLNRQSGMLGVSGHSSDLRDIETRASAGDDASRLAINLFAHQVRKYIGAYAAVMGGVDAIVLSGGIGQNAGAMRRRVLQRLGFLGLVVDDDRNHDARVDKHGDDIAPIHASNSRVAALVVATNEELVIAREVGHVANARRRVQTPEPIPIAISARHVHLTKETFAQLFGADAKLTKLKDISQPGQFASEQQVSVLGPRGRIDGVRILGPFRLGNQVEVSRTDEFKLGVDAPVRDSGHTHNSASVALEGPKGRVTLAEGLICARRHIHMTPEAATRHGVQDKDEVEVAITGGARDLIFGDVLVRVSAKYVLEMHIDTDEANAAELGRGASGSLVYTPVLAATAGIRRKRQ